MNAFSSMLLLYTGLEEATVVIPMLAVCPVHAHAVGATVRVFWADSPHVSLRVQDLATYSRQFVVQV
jgi:hypothetical protein